MPNRKVAKMQILPNLVTLKVMTKKSVELYHKTFYGRN
jgi:hypothetical protein